MSAIWIGSVLVWVSFLMALSFVIAYHWTSRGAWRRDPIGRHLMAFVAVDAAVFGLAAVRLAAGASLDSDWFAWLRVVVFLGVPWTLGWRLWILRRIHRRNSVTASTGDADPTPVISSTEPEEG